MKIINSILFLLFSQPSWGSIQIPAITLPQLVARGTSLAEFFPSGWLFEKRITVDLNNDGKDDEIFVIRSTDPANILKNDGYGIKVINTNPRMLGIIISDLPSKDYFLALSNFTLIPRYTDPTMADPYSDVTIKGGIIKVSLGSLGNLGPWPTGSKTYSIRFQNGCFRIIGYDSFYEDHDEHFERSISVNFLTGQFKSTTKHWTLTREEQQRGDIPDDIVTGALKPIRKICIETIGDGSLFDPGLPIPKPDDRK